MEMIYQAAVIVTYSWENPRITLFLNTEDAEAYLKANFQAEVDYDVENGNQNVCSLEKDGTRATITNFRRDGSVDTTTWWLCSDLSIN